MKPDEIRAMTIPEYEYGNPISEVELAKLLILRELTAQIAEMRQSLDDVLSKGIHVTNHY